jgi:hypothetical protein
MSYYDEMMAKRRAQIASETRPRRAPGASQRVQMSDQDWDDHHNDVLDQHSDTANAATAFFHGLADSVTFGYLDEAGAFLDSALLGKDYDSQLRQNRSRLRVMRERGGGGYGVGEIGGAFVGGLGGIKALKGAGGVKGMVAVGAAEGALYGSGSANGSLLDRMEGAGIGAVLGGGGGYILGGVLMPMAATAGRKAVALFRHGKPPRLTTDFKPTIASQVDELEAASVRAPETPAAAPKATRAADAEPLRVNAITGQTDDVLEDGALLSMRELLGDPGAARAALTKRIGKLTAVEAQRIATRLEDAELDGNVIDDPHFRSLLGIDLSDTKIDTDTAMNAVELLEEAAEAIIAKAGTGGPRGFATVRAEASVQLRQGLIMDDLKKAFEASKTGTVNARIAQHAVMLAGVQFVRAKDKYLPRIMKGDKAAREELAEVLTKSAHILAYAQGTVSNAGRTLGILRAPGKLMLNDVADDLLEVSTLGELRKRVDGALAHLDDQDLKHLLGRLRTSADIEKLEEILMDAERAKDFSLWRRTMNSVSTFLRSNALTPATGIFNAISMVGHDFFRNGIAKRLAARNFERMGKHDEALAMRFEREIARRVYWTAHREGLKALAGRIKWETWGEVEKIAAVGWGRGSVAQLARAKQAQMVERGYKPPDLREYREKPRLAITNLKAFNTKQAERIAGGALGNLVYHAAKAGAVTANTVDALGGASMKLFTGALDDWGRQFVRLKETYALSARHAIREALELKVPQDEMLAYAQKRAVELAELPPSEILQQVEAKLLREGELDPELEFLMRRDREVSMEADRVLFNDGPQTSGGAVSAQVAGVIDKYVVGLGQVEGILLPYIRTPIRLFERGLVSYTPWGAASEEVATALAKGGPEAEIVKAQMEAGMMGIKLGMLLGISGGITLTNGGWNSSANLQAGPPNRVNLPGGGYVELGRLDPFALTLALGGFLGQAVKEGYRRGTEYDAETGFAVALQTAWLAIRDSVLEKSYLTGVQDLMEIMFAKEGQGAANGIDKMLQGAFTRLIPASGTSRQLTDTARAVNGQGAPEAVGWVDAILRSIPGGGLHMDDRIDALGNVVDGRKLGMAIGTNSTDPVTMKLRDLSIDITTLRKADPKGFALTSHELSTLRRIRGTEAYNADGYTMKEALAALFADPAFTTLPEPEQRQQAVVDLMAEFNEPAREIMMERSPKYAANREAYTAFAEYLAEGMSKEEATSLARGDAAYLGLPEPDL